MQKFKKYIVPILSRPGEIFFKNLGLRQTVIKNTSWLALAEGITKFLKFFLFIYIARILGAAEYGKFSFALAFVGLFLIFSHLGVFKILTREFAREPEKEKDFSALLSLKILLSIATFFLIFVGSFFITHDPLIRQIILILGAEILVNSFLVFLYAFFRARQRMEYGAWGEIFTALLVTGFCFFILFNFPSAKNLSLGYLLGTFLGLMGVLFFFHFKVHPLKLSFNRLVWKEYLTMSWPLALGAILGVIYSNIDSTMIGYLGQITEAGWYGAAQKIVAITVIPTGLVTMSFFPLLSKFVKESKEKLQRAWNYNMEAVIFVTIPLVVGGLVLARKIIDFIYDPTYFPGILAFQILLIGLGIAALADPLGHSLLASGQQKRLFWITLAGAVVNVALNLVLIPRYSLYGASISTLFVFLVRFILLSKFTLKYTQVKPLNSKTISMLLLACLASLVMYFVIRRPQVYRLHIFWITSVGFSVYIASCLAFKTLGKCAIKSYQRR